MMRSMTAWRMKRMVQTADISLEWQFGDAPQIRNRTQCSKLEFGPERRAIGNINTTTALTGAPTCCRSLGRRRPGTTLGA